LAVSLLGVLGEIIAMIGLCGIKGLQLCDFRNDGIVPQFSHGSHYLLSRVSLGRVFIEDHGTVLASDIGPLPIQRCGVMGAEKDLQELLVTDNTPIIGDLHHLGMTRLAGAYLLITWIFYMSSAVT